jgi:pyridoxamine 5'-phosphate oxidase
MMLSEDLLPDDPFELFSLWYKEAEASGISDPNAMILATAAAGGKPSARMVLMKELTRDGLVFFTSYNSRKSRELAENPRAAVVFFWITLRRQVRIEGTVSRTGEDVSDRYFATRPRGSRLGARISSQSAEIPSREYLLEEYRKLEQEYRGREIPRPPHWGGLLLIPDSYEFWHEQDMRLHDRIYYRLAGDGWIRRRLAP